MKMSASSARPAGTAYRWMRGAAICDGRGGSDISGFLSRLERVRTSDRFESSRRRVDEDVDGADLPVLDLGHVGACHDDLSVGELSLPEKLRHPVVFLSGRREHEGETGREGSQEAVDGAGDGIRPRVLAVLLVEDRVRRVEFLDRLPTSSNVMLVEHSFEVGFQHRD